MLSNLSLLNHSSRMIILLHPSLCHIICTDANLSFIPAIFYSVFLFYLCLILRILITVFLILALLHLIQKLNLRQFSKNHCSFDIV